METPAGGWGHQYCTLSTSGTVSVAFLENTAMPPTSVSPASQSLENKTTQSHHHLVPWDQQARDSGSRGTDSHKDQHSAFSSSISMESQARSHCGQPGHKQIRYRAASPVENPENVSQEMQQTPHPRPHLLPLPRSASATWAKRKAPPGARKGRLEATRSASETDVA